MLGLRGFGSAGDYVVVFVCDLRNGLSEAVMVFGVVAVWHGVSGG